MTRGRLSGDKAWVRAVIAVLAPGFIWVGFAAGPRAMAFYELAFPTASNATWDSKVGWRLCNGAIADWPGKTGPNCDRLRMCGNEGGLSKAERTRLKQMMTATHCED